MLFIHFHEKFLVYKLETFKNCKDVKRIMIMIIAIICIFLILWDIWSTVENYLQKILCLPPFKVQKVQGPPFCQHWQFFSPPCRKGRGRTPLHTRSTRNCYAYCSILDTCGKSNDIIFLHFFTDIRLYYLPTYVVSFHGFK